MQKQFTRQLRHIYLTGFSGAGKSSVGVRLAAKLKYRFVDLDTVITKKRRASIIDIFDIHGERAFRQEETVMVRKCSLDCKPTVVAVGGGGVERSINRRLMHQSGTVVYLKCSLKELRTRVRGSNDRPLLRGQGSSLAAMRELLNYRKPLYETADITIVTSGRTISQVVHQIRKRVAEL